ncbi:hypothetical protein, partial [Candidatus Endomicrobiellum devescovinae]|uniref:hypothetical protein n=1 Tax=Candidatus Endomicrobiellum devescovinae TaxID=3242322 RepID=UPI0028202FF7|nr:hypothetical protein [Endomicrobium sp.]
MKKKVIFYVCLSVLLFTYTVGYALEDCQKFKEAINTNVVSKLLTSQQRQSLKDSADSTPLDTNIKRMKEYLLSNFEKFSALTQEQRTNCEQALLDDGSNIREVYKKIVALLENTQSYNFVADMASELNTPVVDDKTDPSAAEEDTSKPVTDEKAQDGEDTKASDSKGTSLPRPKAEELKVE